MIGLLQWSPPEAGRRRPIAEQSVLHLRLACAPVVRGPRTPEAVVRRRVAAAARRLRGLGVTRAVLPEGFAYGAALEKYDIAPVSTLALRRSLAADWTRRAMEGAGLSPGSARIAVSAAQMTGELVRTVTELALRNRYVLLDLPYGGGELAGQLRREYGVSLLLEPGREQLEGADALLLFDRREDLPCRNMVVLPLYEGAETPLPPLVLPPALEERLPDGCDRAQLVAALQEAGALRPGQIALGSAAGP